MTTTTQDTLASNILGGDSFEFINLSNGLLPQSNDNRKTIRKQAMSRATAAHRQGGNRGKRRLGQCHPSLSCHTQPKYDPEPKAILGDPVSLRLIGSSDSVNANEACQNHESNELVNEISTVGQPLPRASKAYFPVRLSSTGYDLMRIQLGFDVLDLSALTTFHASRQTARALSEDPSRLVDVLRCRQFSYLSFLPSRIGHSVCVDNAVRCVASGVRGRLSSQSGPPCARTLSLYSKALKSLQVALNHPSHYLQPDVLCATEILALYEMLDIDGGQSWIRHSSGATSLIKLRGPHRYKDEFEKALFLAHAGQIFTEAMLNGTSCFLEEDAWQDVFRSAILDTSPFSDRSSLTISLLMTVCFCPRLFNDVQNAVWNPKAFHPSHLERLITRAYHIRDFILSWRQIYDRITLDRTLIAPPDPKHADKKHEGIGAALAMLIIANRLIIALNPGLASKLEPENQTMAEILLLMENEARVANPRAGFAMALKIIIAQATLATSYQWQNCVYTECDGIGGRPPLVSRAMFEYWCSLQGRTSTLRS